MRALRCCSLRKLRVPAIPWVVVRCLTTRDEVRNVAVIAHVDHGKTTLVDSMLRQSGTLATANNRVLDSLAQEKERGITIMAKNTSVVFPDQRRINIVDTPGHLDFGGEVERALQMVEGFILLVDAHEGVMPGTRYVLRKALKLLLKPIVFVNKIDRCDGDAAIEKTVAQVQDLFIELAEDDENLDVQFLYGSGRNGYANLNCAKEGNLDALFKCIFDHVPPPSQSSPNMPLQMLVSLLDREMNATENPIAIGRIFSGRLTVGDIVLVAAGEQKERALIKKVRHFQGVERLDRGKGEFGDVVAVTLQPPEEKTIPLHIGCSLTSVDSSCPRPYYPPDEATFSLRIRQNTAAWKEVETDRKSLLQHLRSRVKSELLVNAALRAQFHDSHIELNGRGPLHISVVLEEMRREGFEFEVLAPSVIKRVIDGVPHEPYEKLMLEYAVEFSKEVQRMLLERAAEVLEVEDSSPGRLSCVALVAVRLLLNFPVEFWTVTRGEGVLRHCFDSFRPEAVVVSERPTGALMSATDGIVTQYALKELQEHGSFFVSPGDQVYIGQVVGENTRVLHQDVPVNVTRPPEAEGGFRVNLFASSRKKKKAFTIKTLSFEEALNWISPLEVVVCTPRSIRIRMEKYTGRTVNRKAKHN